MPPSATAKPAIAERIGKPDPEQLRELLEELEQIERPSASAGERRAAEWLVERFAELGAEARIEAAPAHGTYWWPLGIGAALGAAAALAALRGRRLLGAALAAAGAAGIADDFPPGKRRLRRLLPKRETYNVVCELGPADAERTIVLIAHHDAAHSGLVFHPGAARDRRPAGDDRADRHQPAADGSGGRRSAAGGARRAQRQAAARQARALARRSARGGDGRDRRSGRRPRRQRQRNLRRRAARPRRAAGRGAPRGGAGDPALDRLGGVLQRGDEGVRRAPLPRACRARAPSSSAWSRSARRTCWCCAARAS